MSKKAIISFEYDVETIEKTRNPCAECALCVGNVMCMSRKICPYTDEKPEVFKFKGLHNFIEINEHFIETKT